MARTPPFTRARRPQTPGSPYAGCPLTKATPQWVLQRFGAMSWATLSADASLQKFRQVIEASKTAALS